MKYEPKVSIIIPVYNGSNFLARQLMLHLRKPIKIVKFL